MTVAGIEKNPEMLQKITASSSLQLVDEFSVLLPPPNALGASAHD